MRSARVAARVLTCGFAVLLTCGFAVLLTCGFAVLLTAGCTQAPGGGGATPTSHFVT